MIFYWFSTASSWGSVYRAICRVASAYCFLLFLGNSVNQSPKPPFLWFEASFKFIGLDIPQKQPGQYLKNFQEQRKNPVATQDCGRETGPLLLQNLFSKNGWPTTCATMYSLYSILSKGGRGATKCLHCPSDLWTALSCGSCAFSKALASQASRSLWVKVPHRGNMPLHPKEWDKPIAGNAPMAYSGPTRKNHPTPRGVFSNEVFGALQAGSVWGGDEIVSMHEHVGNLIAGRILPKTLSTTLTNPEPTAGTEAKHVFRVPGLNNRKLLR